VYYNVLAWDLSKACTTTVPDSSDKKKVQLILFCGKTQCSMEPNETKTA
jgi:hypothetical protein